MSRTVVKSVVVACACCVWSAFAAHALATENASPASEVFDWDNLATDLVAASAPPPIQAHVLAIMQIAIHDALNSIDARYRPYEYAARVPVASAPAAVAAAARDTLSRLLPAAAPQIDLHYAAKLGAIPDGAGKVAGIATGQAAAVAILARRAGDDLFGALSKPYAPGPAAPGVYQPTPPANVVVLAGWGEVAPFVMRSATQFRSRPPLSVASRNYAKDYREVMEFGSATSTKRSAEQTETAHFWFDAATKEWHRAAQQGLADVHADEWQSARTLALLSIAMADAVIASADTKFAFNYWRPITAVRAGDRDGNHATRGDPLWTPLCATPPFPEHNSTHAATGAAAAQVLALTIGDRHEFGVDSPTLAGVRRSYARFSDAAREEGLSRIFCGIHFRNAMDAGLKQGQRVARYAVKRMLKPQ